MIFKKLKNFFAISILVFIAHGLEEYFTGFYKIDGIFQFIFSPLKNILELQTTFLLFQIMFWLLLITFFVFITHETWQLRFMLILGFIYIFELHHIWKVLISWNYYPGAITAIAFPVIGFLFWKEMFLKNYKKVNIF